MWNPLQGLSEAEPAQSPSGSNPAHPGEIPCWNELLALNFLRGRDRFLNPLPSEKRVRRVGKKHGLFASDWRFELVTLRQGFNVDFWDIFLMPQIHCNIRLIMINYALFKTWGQENHFRPPPVFEFLHAVRQMLQHRTTGQGRFGRIVARVKACLNACANVKVQRRWNVNNEFGLGVALLEFF